MFSGKLGFVLSAAGASVGLGNIWRFPYLAAKYGGGIFLLVYIVLALTFGYTMIVAETSLGRMTGKSPVSAFASFGKSGFLKFGGWINAIIPILIVPYYSVIGGWVLFGKYFKTGLVISSLLFMAGHSAFTLQTIVINGIMSAGLAITYYKTKRIEYSMGVHILNNSISVLLSLFV